ncbi:41 helicase [uncultured Caudovirales phage]|uniref:41 helicase n=1 Tax=uncultured Caudovirales phage TaxID=2100421 RepID=A0A6J5NYK6_9CAUD|nr:41 helicase [uncultured Caudovirales phage]CAB4165616.1 41 helicase [uncultured Caudovirales phage]CAB4186733.1 41 helicase [uncultured Caudovirales phage]CAB4220811.1 41 helicase [uncultured Caudovirales phage]
MLKDYGLDVQRLFLEMMLQDAESYVRVQNIYNPENFDRSLRPAAAFIKAHSNEHKTLPAPEQIAAVTGIKLNTIADLDEGHFAWFMEEFEAFTRRQELERAILKSADLLEKGEYAPVEKLIKDAVQISLTKDMGTDYFADPRSRLTALKDGNGQNSTGWPSLDRLLYGGFNRGELQIWAGGSGSGKSLVMQNLSVNWAQAGLNGVYITLELSEGLCAMRIDSMMTNTASKEIFKDLDAVEMKVKMMQKKSGQLRIKYMPAQSTVNDIRAYLKELHVQTGLKADFLCVDYLDLIMPVSAKVSPNDLFVKDKYVSEELRNLAKELNVLFVTASQLNRSAVEEIEFDHSHISGGISKINTADNVFGIFTSRAMRERGRYQIQLMKTRSSSGVGMKVDLEFDIDSLRIRDLGEDQQQSSGFVKKPSILDGIKTQSRVTASEDVGKVSADIQSAKLKQLLGQIKSA